MPFFVANNDHVQACCNIVQHQMTNAIIHFQFAGIDYGSCIAPYCYRNIAIGSGVVFYLYMAITWVWVKGKEDALLLFACHSIYWLMGI